MKFKFWEVCDARCRSSFSTRGLGFLLTLLLISGFVNTALAQAPPSGPPPGGGQSERDMRVVERGSDGKATRISFFNVVNAEIRDILKFMSDETNLTIISSEKVQGKVSIVNLKSITVNEALEAIKTALNTLGFTIVRINRTIVVIPISEAKTRPVRVQMGSDPDQIPSTDEMITQIMPITYADAAELAQNLRNLVPKDADIFADTSTNSVVITDTSSNIHRIAQIIKQLDTSPTEKLETRVIQLKYASASSLTEIITQLFQQGVETARAFQKLSKRGTDEMMKTLDRARQEGRMAVRGVDTVRGQVLIVPDDRTNRLIISASRENLDIISRLVEELDTSEIAKAEIKVFLLNYAIAEDVATELETLLQGAGGRNLPPWEQWRARQLQTRTRGIQGDVNLVADERLNAIVVSSDPQNFPLIEEIIKQLDQRTEPQEVIHIFMLKFADAQSVVENLQDLFQGTSDRNMPWWERERRRFERQMRGEKEQVTGIQGTVNLVADTRLNAIVVSTAAANIPVLQELIGKLDVTVPDLETDTRIFTLKYADAESLADILGNIYQQGGQQDRFFFLPRMSQQRRAGVITGSITVEAYTRTNSLLVTTNSARNFEIIGKLIEQLDQPTPPGFKYSTLIYPLEYSDASELSQLLTDVFSEEGGGFGGRGRGGGMQMSFFRMMMTGRVSPSRDTSTLAGQVRISADTQTNSLIVTTAEKNFDAVKDIIRQLDIIRGQVWLEVKVLEVTLSEDTKLGLEWSWQEGNHLGKKDLTAQFGTDFQLSDESIGFTYKVFNKNLTALLHTLMRENKVRVLSLPSYLTRDNQQAVLSSGKDIPYMTSVRIDQYGRETYDYDFLRNIGINIKITPHIARAKVLKEGEKRTIGLDITQVNASSFIEYTDFNAPVTATNTITTYVDVEDGDQIAIGGMIKSETKKIVHKLPILGSIPFLGRIFKKTEDITEDTQLWVLITPHIIDIQLPEDRERLRKLQSDQINNENLNMPGVKKEKPAVEKGAEQEK